MKRGKLLFDSDTNTMSGKEDVAMGYESGARVEGDPSTLPDERSWKECLLDAKLSFCIRPSFSTMREGSNTPVRLLGGLNCEEQQPTSYPHPAVPSSSSSATYHQLHFYSKSHRTRSHPFSDTLVNQMYAFSKHLLRCLLQYTHMVATTHPKCPIQTC